MLHWVLGFSNIGLIGGLLRDIVVEYDGTPSLVRMRVS